LNMTIVDWQKAAAAKDAVATLLGPARAFLVILWQTVPPAVQGTLIRSA
jgi:hypothetical protein